MASHPDLSAFKTGGKFHQFTYTWTIENLAFWAKKADEYLETDVFRPRLIDDGFWRLRLYPRSRDETLLWYLERIHGERAETVQIHFRIEMRSGGSVHYEYHSNNYPFKKGSGAASATEKTLRDIVGEASLLRDDPQEPLTVVCQMSRKCSSVALSEKLSSYTRIEIGRLTFSWHFGQFSKWNPTEQYTYAGYTYGNAVYEILSCKMHLYTNRNPVDERIGIVIRFRRPPADDFLVVAKISVLDANGKSAISLDETYFEKSGDDTIVWVTPPFIEKKMLTNEAGMYLPNDELTLLSEFKIPVKNIYAVRLQYSLAPCAALQNLEETSTTADEVSISVSTQTIQELSMIENGTQTENWINMIKQEQSSSNKSPQVYVLSSKKTQDVLEDLPKSSTQTFKMVQNIVCSDEKAIQINVDSYDYDANATTEDLISYQEHFSEDLLPCSQETENYDYCAKQEDLISYQEHFLQDCMSCPQEPDNYDTDATIDDCMYYTIGGLIDFDPYYQETDNSENSREFSENHNIVVENDKDIVDKTQRIEVKNYQADITKENVEFSEQDNFTKQHSASTEDMYEEDSTSEDEDSGGSEGTSSSGGSNDTSQDDSDATTSEGDSESSDDATTSEDNDYMAFENGARRPEASTADNIHDTSEEHSEDEGIFRRRLDELDDSYSAPLTCFVVVYFIAMSIYFFGNDAISYPKQTPSLFYSYSGNSEFVKHLTFLYAEALDDPNTLKLIDSYSSSRLYTASEHFYTKTPFPISYLSTKNAWVLLALADSHKDSELMRAVLAFLEANKDATINSPAWRKGMDVTMKKAHEVFRQRFTKRAVEEESEVPIGT